MQLKVDHAACQYKHQDFISVRHTAHNEDLDCNPSEAVPESKKDADFLKGIADPKTPCPFQYSPPFSCKIMTCFMFMNDIDNTRTILFST